MGERPVDGIWDDDSDVNEEVNPQGSEVDIDGAQQPQTALYPGIDSHLIIIAPGKPHGITEYKPISVKERRRPYSIGYQRPYL